MVLSYSNEKDLDKKLKILTELTETFGTDVIPGSSIYTAFSLDQLIQDKFINYAIDNLNTAIFRSSILNVENTFTYGLTISTDDNCKYIYNYVGNYGSDKVSIDVREYKHAVVYFIFSKMCIKDIILKYIDSTNNDENINSVKEFIASVSFEINKFLNLLPFYDKSDICDTVKYSLIPVIFKLYKGIDQLKIISDYRFERYISDSKLIEVIDSFVMNTDNLKNEDVDYIIGNYPNYKNLPMVIFNKNISDQLKKHIIKKTYRQKNQSSFVNIIRNNLTDFGDLKNFIDVTILENNRISNKVDAVVNLIRKIFIGNSREDIVIRHKELSNSSKKFFEDMSKYISEDVFIPKACSRSKNFRYREIYLYSKFYNMNLNNLSSNEIMDKVKKYPDVYSTVLNYSTLLNNSHNDKIKSIIASVDDIVRIIIIDDMVSSNDYDLNISSTVLHINRLLDNIGYDNVGYYDVIDNINNFSEWYVEAFANIKHIRTAYSKYNIYGYDNNITDEMAKLIVKLDTNNQQSSSQKSSYYGIMSSSVPLDFLNDINIDVFKGLFDNDSATMGIFEDIRYGGDEYLVTLVTNILYLKDKYTSGELKKEVYDIILHHFFRFCRNQSGLNRFYRNVENMFVATNKYGAYMFSSYIKRYFTDKFSFKDNAITKYIGKNTALDNFNGIIDIMLDLAKSVGYTEEEISNISSAIQASLLSVLL